MNPSYKLVYRPYYNSEIGLQAAKMACLYGTEAPFAPAQYNVTHNGWPDGEWQPVEAVNTVVRPEDCVGVMDRECNGHFYVLCERSKHGEEDWDPSGQNSCVLAKKEGLHAATPPAPSFPDHWCEDHNCLPPKFCHGLEHGEMMCEEISYIRHEDVYCDDKRPEGSDEHNFTTLAEAEAACNALGRTCVGVSDLSCDGPTCQCDGPACSNCPPNNFFQLCELNFDAYGEPGWSDLRYTTDGSHPGWTPDMRFSWLGSCVFAKPPDVIASYVGVSSPPSTPPDVETSSGTSGLATGGTVGVAVGATFLVLLAVGAGFVLIKIKKKAPTAKASFAPTIVKTLHKPHEVEVASKTQAGKTDKPVVGRV